MTRTYWLSFSDEGEFLGIAIVDVTADDAAQALAWIDAHWPMHAAGAEWVAAATHKAHQTGCNPGGEVLSADVTGLTEAVSLPKGTLLSRADLDAFGLEVTSVREALTKTVVH